MSSVRGMKKCILLLGLCALLLTAAALAPSLAWYRPVNADFGPASINGHIRSAYFESGDGTVSDQAPEKEHAAYEIKYPEQFYNLAWLQYLGYFNKAYDADGNETDSGQIKPTYFYLSADLDMTGKILPPIGTSDYPFIGSFDGCGHTVSNLTVANTADSVELAVNKDDFTAVEIVGVFGVVGSLAAETNGTESSAALDVEKNYTYSSITNEVKNVTFANVTVETKTANALAGLAAGYVNGTLKNVGVADSTLDIKAGTAALGYTGNLSDYSLVGYCTEPYRGGWSEVSVEHSEPVTLPVETFVAQGNGETSAWGGSIQMDKLFTRLGTIYNKASSLTYKYNGNSTGSRNYYKGYKSDEEGSFCFYAENNNFKYISGKDHRTYSASINIANGTTGYVGMVDNYTTHYLSAEYADVTATVVDTTNRDNAVTWTFSYSSGKYALAAQIGDTIYYLTTSDNATLTLTTTQTFQWTKRGSGNGLYSGTTGFQYYSLTYDNGWRVSQASTVSQLVVGTTFDNEDTMYDTYIPLNVKSDNDYAVKDQNTGYIVGGANTTSTSRTQLHSDIRVSQYNISNISTSTGSDSSYQSKDFEVLTRTADSNGYRRIQDDYNQNSSNSKLSGYEKQTIEQLGLSEKYEASRKAMHDLLNGQTKIYGLHFMGGDLTKRVKAEQVTINEETYSNYEMPEDCIDFHLKDAGYINFFAGTYFSSDVTCFFSLHRIVRDDDQKIKSMFEISRIYKVPDGTDESGRQLYSYVYRDVENNIYDKNDQLLTDLPAGAVEVFDTEWLTWKDQSGNPVQKAVYYFEIPVNAGEYALGCTDDTNDVGAYLLYLDISANAQEITRTTTVEVITTTTKTHEYPLGVDFVEQGGRNTGDASAAVALPVGGGEVHFSRNEYNNITFITFTPYAGSSAAYVVDGVTLKLEGTNDPVDVKPSRSSVAEERIVTLHDVNRADTSNYPSTIRIVKDSKETFLRYFRTTPNNSETEVQRKELEKDLNAHLPAETDSIFSQKAGTTVLNYSYTLLLGEIMQRSSTYEGTTDPSSRLFTVTLLSSMEVNVTATVSNDYQAAINGTSVGTGTIIRCMPQTGTLRLSIWRPGSTDRKTLKAEDASQGETFWEPYSEEASGWQNGYQWTGMTEQEMVDWLCNEENEETIRAVPVVDTDSTALHDLFAMAEAIRDETLRQTALDRLAVLFGPLKAVFPWEDMTDEEFMAWLLDEENAEWLVKILGDETTEAYQSLLQRIEDIEDEAQRFAAEARLEELRKRLAQHPWEKQTDEDFVYWLSDDTNLVTIRNILADEESEAYASLLARVAAIKDEALRAQAEARLALIRRLLPKKYDWDTQTDEDFVYWLRDDTNVSAVRAALDDSLAELSLRERIRAIVDAALRALAEARLEEIRASDGIYRNDKDTEVVRPGGGVYEVKDDTEIVQPPSPGGTYGIGSDTEVSPPSSGSIGLYRNGADTQLISVANAAETGSTPIAVFLPAWSAPAPVQIAALPSADSIPRAGKGKYGR